jgi:hypothetical protein
MFAAAPMLRVTRHKQPAHYHSQTRASRELDYHCLVDERGRVFDAGWDLPAHLVQAA